MLRLSFISYWARRSVYSLLCSGWICWLNISYWILVCAFKTCCLFPSLLHYFSWLIRRSCCAGVLRAGTCLVTHLISSADTSQWNLLYSVLSSPFHSCVPPSLLVHLSSVVYFFVYFFLALIQVLWLPFPCFSRSDVGQGVCTVCSCLQLTLFSWNPVIFYLKAVANCLGALSF